MFQIAPSAKKLWGLEGKDGKGLALHLSEGVWRDPTWAAPDCSVGKEVMGLRGKRRKRPRFTSQRRSMEGSHVGSTRVVASATDADVTMETGADARHAHPSLKPASSPGINKSRYPAPYRHWMDFFAAHSIRNTDLLL
ncbi:hypothetical protein QE152_g37885 [Popillia japonica]|uniref:Uncharacterized protein n=1 Tax=Popillia japonica TaxID=7064 RepID=A0AAW1I9T2_POPJA